MNSSNPPPIEPPQAPAPIQHKVNWLIFFAALLAPPVLTLFAAMSKSDGAAVACPLIGGGIVGIICGIMLARRVGRTQGSRVLLGFVFTAVFGFLSFALGFVGCMMGGFKMDFR